MTDRKVLGSGDASGMFPLDAKGCAFDPEMVARFDALLMKKGFSFQLKDVLPAILKAGEEAGVLTEKGARLLDPSGALQPGARLCPPEGDAGTGMTATNSITPCTGNVSAGTSVFAMLVLEHSLSKVHPEIDIVTTPDGKPVAMVHCNTCTSDIDAWVNLLGEMAEAAGAKLSKNRLYELFYTKALSGDPDCGGLVNYNYYSGEPVTNIPDGRPLFMRRPDADLSLANFARAQLYSAISTLKLGIDLLFQEENVQVKSLLGHGGLFKTTTVGQQLLAGALNVPVSVMETAGEGGPWGMALLASYMVRREAGETLEHYLADKVFRETESRTVQPNPADTEGFARYIKTYVRGLATERSAVEAFR